MNRFEEWSKLARKLVRFANIPEPSYQGNPGVPPVDAEQLDDAKIVGSRIAGTDKHIVAIDLDLDAVLVPSSTPGHHHLYIDREMDWDTYEQLLVALFNAGLIEEGYLDVSLRREETHLRTPWTKKTAAERTYRFEDDYAETWPYGGEWLMLAERHD